MQFLELTLDTPEENLALDEALIETAERDPDFPETLRIWEPQSLMVVVGRSSRVSNETYSATCQQDGVPILRRTSGGTAIVTGVGCLMYALILSYQRRSELRMIEHAHQFVLNSLAVALSSRIPGIQRAGISDLVTQDQLKFSGNSLRCRRHTLLYHGTLLYDFPIRQIGRYLATAPRQPEYRQGRDHDSFVTNLSLPRAQLRDILLQAWPVTEVATEWPEQLTHDLVAQKYTCDKWNRKF